MRNGLNLGTMISRILFKMGTEGAYLSSQVLFETMCFSKSELVSPGRAVEERKWGALFDQTVIKW